MGSGQHVAHRSRPTHVTGQRGHLAVGEQLARLRRPEHLRHRRGQRKLRALNHPAAPMLPQPVNAFKSTHHQLADVCLPLHYSSRLGVRHCGLAKLRQTAPAAVIYPGQMPSPGAGAAQINIDGAIGRLHDRVHTTPLLHSRLLDQAVGGRVWLKAENFQRAGSFKSRGAFNAALVGLEEKDSRGLLALSSGNHGQAVALAAAELGLSAVVVMSEGSSPVKIAAVRSYGAEVVTEGVNLGNRERVASELAAERGLRLIHPHDDPHVISGQATVGYELAGQLQARGVEAPLVLVPLGGGGLLAGMAIALRRWLPKARVAGVEPESGNDGALSLASGRRVTLPEAPVTVADGAATLRLGAIDWEVIRTTVDDIVTVSDRQIGEACWWLWSRCKLVVEPTGALGVAAALSTARSLAGLRQSASGADPTEIVCVLTGGNCLPSQIADLVESVAGQPPRF